MGAMTSGSESPFGTPCEPTAPMPDMAVLLEAFQICDSTFPIGTFNHSFGMETYNAEGSMRKVPQFEEWICSYFSAQYRFGEGLLVILAYRALDVGDEGALWYLDQELTLATPAAETRTGTKLAFAIFAHGRGIPVREAYLMYGYSVASTLVQMPCGRFPLTKGRASWCCVA